MARKRDEEARRGGRRVGRAARLVVGVAVIALGSAWALDVGAAAPPDDGDASRARLEAEIERLRATVSELQASRDATARELAALRKVVELLQQRMAALAPAAGTDVAAATTPARSDAPSGGSSTLPASPSVPPDGSGAVSAAPSEPRIADSRGAGTPAEEETVGTTKEEKRRVQVEREILERQGGVLLPAGQLVVEPRFQYSNTTRNILEVNGFSLIPAIIIGQINVADIKRDTYGASLGLRYGLDDWLELEVDVPYLYRSDVLEITETNDPTRDQSDDHGLGDVNFGLFAHVVREARWRPDLILNLRAKSDTGRDPFDIGQGELATGTGTWAVSGGFTMVRTVDPAVMFFSSNYYWAIARHVSGFGAFDPGDTFEYSLGLAFSLNERLALSSSLSHRITNRSTLDGEKILRSDANAASMFLGASYRLNQWTNLNVSLGIGITEDAPDFSIEVRTPLRLPYRLPSFKTGMPDLKLPSFKLPSLREVLCPILCWRPGFLR